MFISGYLGRVCLSMMIGIHLLRRAPLHQACAATGTSLDSAIAGQVLLGAHILISRFDIIGLISLILL
jgi:hypothetical protein